MVGRTVLQYQFQEKLGAGGMGEIYKALDTRLNRFVAVKVLTTAAAGDPERRRRFIQEAQAASALNHPNIITIHDIISEGDTEFMVMEYVSGKTLVDLIPKGGLNVAQVLKYSVQIADALQAAHVAGIVHRDLKPSNVMVTDSGLIKILDFGLAKLTDRGPLTTLSSPNDATQTIAEAPLTVEGSIIGTVSYMSPEQAQGKKVDTRSDIFSFGVVLFEMVTGARAFQGESALTTLSAILRDDVKPVAEFAPDAPPQLEMVIRRCLKKNPDERWQTMQDVEMALAALKHESDSGTLYRARLSAVAPPPAPRASSVVRKSGPGPVLVGVIAGTILLAAVGGGTLWWTKHHKPPEPPPEAVATAPETPAAPETPPPADVKPVANPDEAMTNDNVIEMADAKVSTNQIIAQIRGSKNTNFLLTPAELIRLSKAGIPDSVIEVMRNPKKAPTVAVNNPPPPVSSPPKQTSPNPPSTPAAATTPPASTAPPAQSPQQPAVVQTPPPAALPSGTKTAAASAPGMMAVTVKDGTPFSITLTEDIPANAEEDRPLHFTVTSDVRAGDKVVIAKGAQVTGAVAEVPGKKKFLNAFGGGKMSLKLSQVDGADGKKLSIRALQARKADGSYRPVDTGKAKPKDLAATAGTEYVGYVDGDQTVAVHK